MPKPAEAPLSRTERFPPSEAHMLLGLTKTSQRAYEQEHNISSKAVILSSHLLTGRVSNEVGPAVWPVVGLQDDASRRKENSQASYLHHTSHAASQPTPASNAALANLL